MGDGSRGGTVVDSRILGLGEWSLRLQPGLLGPDSRLLRRCELRLRLWRSRVRRRPLGGRRIQLQHSSCQCKQDRHSQHLCRSHGRRKPQCESCQFQRGARRSHRTAHVGAASGGTQQTVRAGSNADPTGQSRKREQSELLLCK